jgi:hypothetical protein
MDPAMVSDWVSVTDGKSYFTEREGFTAAKSFLENYYNRGPLTEIRTVLDFMERPGNEEADPMSSLALWRSCWNEVGENAQNGDIFSTAYCYARNRDGLSGRFQRDVHGFLKFVPNEASTTEEQNE